MGVYMVKSMATYTERLPVVFLISLLGFGVAIWKYKSAVSNNCTPKPTSDNESQKTYPSIEPLPDFNWETTEPLKFRPFKPKYHLTMALSNLDPSTLIQMDKTYKDRLAIRSSLLQKHPDVVIGINSESDPRVYAAIRELYVFVVGTYLPTRYPQMFRLTSQPSDGNSKTGTETKTILESMVTGSKIPLHFNGSEPGFRTGRRELEILGTLVDEEFLILLPESSSTHPSSNQGESEKYILEAYTTFFPAGFDTRKKLGLRLASIHTPVPGYKEKLERSMDRFFARIEVGQFVQRVNWSITTDSELFAAFGGVHGDEGEGEKTLNLGELEVDSTVLSGLLQSLHDLHQVGGHAHGSHVTASTAALDNEGVATVTLRVEADDVVTALQTSNGAILVEVLQADTDLLLTHINATNVTHNLTFLLSSLLNSRHLTIELGQASHELLDTISIRRLDLQTGDTCQNSQLPGDIHTVQVITGIRLSIAKFLGLRNDLAPLCAGWPRNRGEGVEQEGQCAGEDTLDASNLIPGANEIAEGGDHGETCTDGALMVYKGLALCGGSKNVLPQGEVGGETLLVGGNDGDALAEENGVGAGEGEVAGVVDENGATRGGGEVGGNFVDGESARFDQGGGLNGGFPVCSGDGGGVGRCRRLEGLAGAGEEDELGSVGETGKLAQEGCAYTSDSCDAISTLCCCCWL
ncbi:hypothetical protein BDV38DRAFT_268823 [Aspergillus pseudotamarii]|uniref:Uncharacterized protein n=1 Tax=Aspergillus pseudotamarii TaxID=132259 RepID=A0A5N6T4D3_ASPPS|nr:uncharacterized protein BDV38DRAFT_268823 [Aspergillus pseudotamarii]KAE8141165.1 hypothetical protein BDV38DRAFT_268823 [Aspergillus pseudotamarii]